MSNMYLSILRAMGIEEESFSDSTGTLTTPIFSRTVDQAELTKSK